VHPRTHPRQSTLTRTHMDTSTCARNCPHENVHCVCMYLCRLPGKFLIKKGWQPRGCLHQSRDRAGEVQSWRVLQVDLLAHTKYPQLSTSTHWSGCKDARAKNYVHSWATAGDQPCRQVGDTCGRKKVSPSYPAFPDRDALCATACAYGLAMHQRSQHKAAHTWSNQCRYLHDCWYSKSNKNKRASLSTDHDSFWRQRWMAQKSTSSKLSTPALRKQTTSVPNTEVVSRTSRSSSPARTHTHRTHTCTHTHAHRCPHMYTQKHTHTHTQRCAHTYTHIRTHTYTHICTAHVHMYTERKNHLPLLHAQTNVKLKQTTLN